MKRFFQLIVFLVIPSLLAGCFRSAGDTIEPTQDASSNSIAIVATTPITESIMTPTLPPITILSPNTRAPVTETPAEATATRPPQTIVAPPTATPQFITPGSPSGPVLVETLLPEPTTNGEETTDSAPLVGSTPNATSTSGDDECIYIVQSGDSLYGIALEYDTTVQALREANPTLEGDPPILYPDDELILPDCGDLATPVRSTAVATIAPTSAGTPGTGEVYTVESGDTLFSIAGRYGITIADIVAANPGMDPDRLSIGQRIVIPASED